MSDSGLRLVSLALTAILAACGVGAGDSSDEMTTRSLGEPTATLPDDFGSIQTVREMPDGRVLVADPLGKVLYLTDMDAGTREVIGSEGAGPGEYLQPDAAWPLPGDSTLLVDLGNSRLVALGPDLSFGPTTPLVMGDAAARLGLVMALPQGVDAQGRVYAQSRGGGFGTEPPDSAAILRIDRGTQASDTAGMYKVRGQIRSVAPGTGGRGIRVQQIPLSPEDAWGVGADGAVVVARSSDYHIDWLEPDGSVTSGPPAPWESLPIGQAEKEEWALETSRTGGISMQVRIGGGSTETSISRAGGRGRGDSDLDQYEWPEVLPPFHDGRIPVDPESRAWVRRHVGAGGPPLYDVFGRDGEHLGAVELGSDRRVIAFGDGTVYVVRFDEFDLNYLERYAAPEF